MIAAVPDKVRAILDKADSKVNVYVMLFALFPILLLLLFPTSWNGNEEKYFQSAYQRVAPDQFTEFHAVFDSSSAKFATEYALGTLVAGFGYETAHTISRVLMAVLYTVALVIFFSAIGMSLLNALTVIALFSLFGEQLIGGEWLFHGVEGKTFAYAAVLASFGFALRASWLASVILMVVATYFHILVGGFWMMGLLLLSYLKDKNLSQILKLFILYALSILPIVILIAIDQSSMTHAIAEVNPNEIYAMRVKHHVAPFSSLYQLSQWMPGIIAVCAILFAFFLNKPSDDDDYLRMFIILTLSYLLVALMVSFLDRHTFYVSKFFLFRPSSLILLIAITVFLKYLNTYFSVEAGKPFIQVTAAAIVLYFAGTLLFDKASALMKEESHVMPNQAELIAAIEMNSKKGEIVLIEPYQEMNQPYISLPRILPRPTLVSYKFTPNNPKEIIHWNDLIKMREQIFNKGCVGFYQYPIRLLLVLQKKTLDTVKSCGDVVWEAGDHSLIKITPK